MAVLLIVVLGGIASQGHASVAELSNLQIAAQAVHITAVAVWIVGLAMVAIIMVRLPKVAADAGPRGWPRGCSAASRASPWSPWRWRS